LFCFVIKQKLKIMWRIKRIILGTIYLIFGTKSMDYFFDNHKILNLNIIKFFVEYLGFSSDMSMLFSFAVCFFVIIMIATFYLCGLHYWYTVIFGRRGIVKNTEEKNGSFILQGILFFWKIMSFEMVRHPERYYVGKKKKGENGNENDLSNIDSVIQYRNGVLSTMSSENAVREYSKTSWIDTTIKNANGNENTRSAITFLNSKLSTMGPDKGYNYIKNSRI